LVVSALIVTSHVLFQPTSLFRSNEQTICAGRYYHTLLATKMPKCVYIFLIHIYCSGEGVGVKNDDC